MFLDLAKKRYSSRKFEERVVPDDVENKILETARVAPTAANKQPVHLIVVKSKAGLEKISKGCSIYDAPLAVIVCGEKDKAWVRPYDNANAAIVDASIITDHMMLSAFDLGVGSVWVYHFNPEIIRAEFNIPENLEPMHILALGYSCDKVKSPDRHDKDRKPLKDIVTFESF